MHDNKLGKVNTVDEFTIPLNSLIFNVSFPAYCYKEGFA